MRFLFFLTLLFSMAFCEHIRWQNEYEKALLEAKKEKKKIVLLVLKKECVECKTIFIDIFKDSEVEAKISSEYIPIVVFFEDKNSYPIELFYTQLFPTLFFVSQEDESFLQEPLFKNFTKKEVLNNL